MRKDNGNPMKIVCGSSRWRESTLRVAHLSLLKYAFVVIELLGHSYTTPTAGLQKSTNPRLTTQIQESLFKTSSSIGYNITSFAATNLKGTNLPVPAPPAAATTVSTPAPSAETDRPGKALGLCAQGGERVAGARLDQDANIADNFLHPWQTTLNTSIAVALKARQAVRMSRLELDAAKQSYVVSPFEPPFWLLC